MDKVILNEKEQKRLMVLNEVLAGRLTAAPAAEHPGLSLERDGIVAGVGEMPTKGKEMAR